MNYSSLVSNIKNFLEDDSTEFSDSIDAIISQAEDTISDLMKTASRNFKLLNDKLQGVTVKKLVSKNPTMKAKFLELKNNI